MINNLSGPVEPKKTIKMLWKKLSNRNNDILNYNFPASSLVLASAEEFLQSQTCYFKSSSNYTFSFYGRYEAADVNRNRIMSLKHIYVFQ